MKPGVGCLSLKRLADAGAILIAVLSIAGPLAAPAGAGPLTLRRPPGNSSIPTTSIR